MKTKNGAIPIIESDKNGYWETYQNRKIWHNEVKPPINMPEKDWKFVSPFIRGADLPDGEPVEFEVRKDKDGKCWGWRDSKTEYGCEVLFPDGIKRVIEFFVNLFDSDGQEKIWTRNSQTFWRSLEKLDLKEGDRVKIIKVGEDKQARYTLTLAKRTEEKEPKETKKEKEIKKKEK